MADSDFSQLLRSIRSGQPLASVLRNAQRFRIAAAAATPDPMRPPIGGEAPPDIKPAEPDPAMLEPQEVEDVSRYVIYLETMVEQLQREANYASEMLSVVRYQADQMLASWMAGIEAGINDSDSAINAANNYNRRWFANLPFSEAGKIEVAQRLLNACSRYTSHNQTMWKRIVERNPGALDAVSTPTEA